MNSTRLLPWSPSPRLRPRCSTSIQVPPSRARIPRVMVVGERRISSSTTTPFSESRSAISTESSSMLIDACNRDMPESSTTMSASSPRPMVVVPNGISIEAGAAGPVRILSMAAGRQVRLRAFWAGRSAAGWLTSLTSATRSPLRRSEAAISAEASRTEPVRATAIVCPPAVAAASLEPTTWSAPTAWSGATAWSAPTARSPPSAATSSATVVSPPT